jgi:hypothetical protein
MLQAAHWTINESASTSAGIVIKRRGYQIIVGLDNVTTCKQTIVNVR